MTRAAQGRKRQLSHARDCRHGDPRGEAAEPTIAANGPDIYTLLGDLSDAISVVTVVDRSLAAQELAGAGDEEVTLRHALTLLRTVYDRLDRATSH